MENEPMLARPFEGDVDDFILNSDWVFEQKIDGKRALIEVKDRVPTAYNRKGQETNLPHTIIDAFDNKGFNGYWMFDGEILDHEFWVFDVIACPGANYGVTDLRDLAFSQRRQFLEQLFETWTSKNVKLVRQEFVDVRKSMLLKRIHDEGGEGIVIKNLTGRYQSGKRSDAWLKLKFTATHEVVVTELNPEGKEFAVRVGHIHDGVMIDAGGLKIPERLIEGIRVGDVLEARYLYATEDKKLYQPIFIRKRTDKHPEDCTTEGLQYTNRKVVVA